MKKLLILIVIAASAGSCVSTKKFNSMRADAMRYESELSSAKIRGDELAKRNNMLTEQVESLATDTARLGYENRELTERYKRLLSDGSAEASRMLLELESRTRRVEELEQLLRAREDAIDAIRRKVAGALLGFEGNGLAISVKDGKVYVSMDDKLLFRSGSFDIESKGAEAIRELGIVLAQNPDINIMVEGHTDDLTYRPNGNLKDNLDLSVKRATTVTRLLLENKDIAPDRIISAGRGEYLPVDLGKTPEARAKNRRTEIILSPKLDELMQIMDR